MKLRILFILSVIFSLSVSLSSPTQAFLKVIGTASYEGAVYQLIWENDNNGKSLIWLDYTRKPDDLDTITSWVTGLETQLILHITPPYHVTWIDPAWRLPETADDGKDSVGCDGSTSTGWNITSSEMGHLFYTSLESLGYKDSSCKYQSYSHKFAPFKNLQPKWFWSETKGSNHPEWPWAFDFWQGEQKLLHGTGWSITGLTVRTARVTTGAETCSSNYLYYMPYFASGEGKWTGLGLSNDSPDDAAEVCVSVFAPNGEPLAFDSRIIQPDGQGAFPVTSGSSSFGWIRIQSSAPLSGLSFIGVVNDGVALMADIPVVSQLSEKLVIPQVAHDETWGTQIYMANPEANDITVKMAYFNPKGETPYGWESYPISAKGCLKVDVGELLNQKTALNGKVVIQSNGGGITAFALYNDLKSGGHYFAGVNAEIPAGAPE